jgi:hypothetical protein
MSVASLYRSKHTKPGTTSHSATRLLKQVYELGTIRCTEPDRWAWLLYRNFVNTEFKKIKNVHKLKNNKNKRKKRVYKHTHDTDKDCDPLSDRPVHPSGRASHAIQSQNILWKQKYGYESQTGARSQNWLSVSNNTTDSDSDHATTASDSTTCESTASRPQDVSGAGVGIATKNALT